MVVFVTELLLLCFIIFFFFQREINGEKKGQRQADVLSCTFSRSKTHVFAVNSWENCAAR